MCKEVKGNRVIQVSKGNFSSILYSVVILGNKKRTRVWNVIGYLRGFI
jgi:hypothetical protein